MSASAPSTAGREALESMYDIMGRHPGCRSGHAEGRFCAGFFTPSAVARELTEAAHMQGDPVKVTARFSNVTGDPDKHDAARNARGLAVRFHLPEGSYTDLIALTLPCFANRRPEDFVEMNYSCFKYRSGKTKQRPLGTLHFVIRHPEAFKAMKASFGIKPVPSYANCRYNSLNAFVWTNRETGVGCYVRYSWIPQEGERTIDKGSAKRRASDFLQRDLEERLGRSSLRRPIRFSLVVQLASTDDEAKGRVEDSTKPWPTAPDRIVPAAPRGTRAPVSEDGMRERHLAVGELELTELVEGPALGDQAFGFGPLNLTDGIAPSDDEILKFRPGVYELAARDRLVGFPERG